MGCTVLLHIQTKLGCGAADALQSLEADCTMQRKTSHAVDACHCKQKLGRLRTSAKLQHKVELYIQKQPTAV